MAETTKGPAEVKDAPKVETGDESKGVFIGISPTGADGEDEISIHPVGIDNLSVPALVIMAANLVKRNLDM